MNIQRGVQPQTGRRVGIAKRGETRPLALEFVRVDEPVNRESFVYLMAHLIRKGNEVLRAEAEQEAFEVIDSELTANVQRIIDGFARDISDLLPDLDPLGMHGNDIREAMEAGAKAQADLLNLSDHSDDEENDDDPA